LNLQTINLTPERCNRPIPDFLDSGEFPPYT
jgi:hypothetical protein